MNAGILAVLVAFTWPPEPAGSTRDCIDAAGHKALCSAYDADPNQWHECRASDSFGRCPKDPTCFDDGGKQTRCIGKLILTPAK